MTTYSISPDLFKRSNFNDEYEDWMLGCLKSKWESRSSSFMENVDDDTEDYIVKKSEYEQEED